MKELLDIQDELDTARQFVECAYHACSAIEDSNPIAAVLDAASDKIKAAVEALSAITPRPVGMRL